VVEFERLVSRDCGQCGIAIGQNKPCFEIDLAGCAERTHSDYFGTGLPGHGGGAAAEQRAPARHLQPLPAEGLRLPEEVALLFRSIGEHLGMALENARLKRENLRIVLTSERQMMAAEIHDSLAQTWPT
jgi:two-component system nitrate/nitrite sensor histidine kinase NarX